MCDEITEVKPKKEGLEVIFKVKDGLTTDDEKVVDGSGYARIRLNDARLYELLEVLNNYFQKNELEKTCCGVIE